MTTDPSRLERELRQKRPFESRAQEATVGIVRTASLLQRYVTRVMERYGVTPQQYNVLRILRGAHPNPLSRQEIWDRMIEQQPGVTRLLDRMEAKGLVRRERSTDDRRVVYCWITDAGLQLLAEMDRPVLQADEYMVRRLSHPEREQLIRLLDLVRAFEEG